MESLQGKMAERQTHVRSYLGNGLGAGRALGRGSGRADEDAEGRRLRHDRLLDRPDSAAPEAGLRPHVPGAVRRLGEKRSGHRDDDRGGGDERRPGEYAARLGQGGSGRARAAAPRQSLLHAAGVSLVSGSEAALAPAVPYRARPGVPERIARARGADRAAPEGAAREPRSEGSAEPGFWKNRPVVATFR